MDKLAIYLSEEGRKVFADWIERGKKKGRIGEEGDILKCFGENLRRNRDTWEIEDRMRIKIEVAGFDGDEALMKEYESYGVRASDLVSGL